MRYREDDRFFQITAHVDRTLKDKIAEGEVDIDPSKLLIKPKQTNDHRLDLIHKDGRSYYLPSHEKELPIISSVKTWEQAFRVLSCIYTQSRPQRANQLYQYVGTICEAATTFIWNNVYNYDQLFRQLITAFPDRSWAVIYNHGYIMCLKEHLPTNRTMVSSIIKSNKGGTLKDKELCWIFNKGKCTCGPACKFDHRCSYCNKQGHSLIVGLILRPGRKRTRQLTKKINSILKSFVR